MFNARNILDQGVSYKTPCYTSYLHQIQADQHKIQQVKHHTEKNLSQIPVSDYHRIVEVERDVLRSSKPTPLLKQGQLAQFV